MTKAVGVYLDRESLNPQIEELGKKEWGNTFKSEPLVQMGTQYRCEFSVDNKKAMLDFYFKTDGSATLRATGSNMEYSERLKELITENNFRNEHDNSNCKFASVSKETFESLNSYLSSLERISVVEDRKIPTPAHRHIKYKSTFGDSLVINMYDSGTLLFQGNPAYILTEAMYFMAMQPEISEEEVSAQQKVVYKAETISVPEARRRMKARIPVAYEKLEDIALKILSPSFSLSNSCVEAEEYSCYVFPALRTLEAILLQLLLKKGLMVAPPSNLGSVFKKDDTTGDHVLNERSRMKVGDPVYAAQLERIYNYLKAERHTIFHANQILILTRLIFDKTEADAILNQVLDIIEDTARKVM